MGAAGAGGELEMDQPVGGYSVAIDFGGGEVPAVGRLQSLVGKIFAGAGGEEFSGGDVAGGIDVEFYGDAHSAANGGQSFFGNGGHDLVEHFALRDGAGGGRLGDGIDPSGVGDFKRRGSGGRRRIRRSESALVIRFLQRSGRRSLRYMLRRRRHDGSSRFLRGLGRRFGARGRSDRFSRGRLLRLDGRGLFHRGAMAQ